MKRPAYLLEMPEDEYHGATKRNEYISSHRLNTFRKCPALYIKHVRGEIVEGDTEAFTLGRATHALVLQGAEKFAEDFVVHAGPVNPKTGNPYGKTTKAYLEWAATMALPVISPDDAELMRKMQEAVHAHALARDILADGIAEGVVRAEWCGLPVQARLDWYDPERGILADLKTCDDMDKFGYNIRDFGYVFQLAFYAKCLELAGADVRDMSVYLVAVEKREPYRVSVWKILPSTIYAANNDPTYAKNGPGNETCLRELAECRERDEWPTRFEEVIQI